MAQNFLVIGATGYIGQYLFSKAGQYGPTVGTSSTKNNVGGLLHLDLRNPTDFTHSVYNEDTIVFLTAANSSPDQCTNNYSDAYNINVTGTSKLIEKLLKQKAKIIFFSSDTVYGEREDPFDETSPKKPAGKYAEMKLAVERRFTGSPYFKVIHLSYVFSKEDKFSQYLLNCHENDKKAEIFDPFKRAVIYLNDLCDAAINLGTRWTEFAHDNINFGGPQLISRVDFVATLKKLYLKDLHYNVTEPAKSFFENRPKVINMQSPLLKQILEREPLSLEQSIKSELNSEK